MAIKSIKQKEARALRRLPRKIREAQKAREFRQSVHQAGGTLQMWQSLAQTEAKPIPQAILEHRKTRRKAAAASRRANR